MKDSMYEAMYQQETDHWWYKGKRDIVNSLINKYFIKHDNQIIDFGCGCGLMLHDLTHWGLVTGVDFSERALDYCRQHFEGELYLKDISKIINEDNGIYDLVVALDILEHIPDDRIAVKNLKHYMKEGGKAIITVPACPMLWSSHDVNCAHFRRYTYKTLKKCLEDAQLSIDFISYYNFFLFLPVALVRMLFRAFKINGDSKLENNTPNTFFNILFYKIFSSEKYLFQKEKHFPFGVSLIAVVSKNL